MRKKVVILGAGISGLVCAWYLSKKYRHALEIIIVEKSARPGGWIRTENYQGELFESGPRSIKGSGKGQNTLSLVEELGLQDAVICQSPLAKSRFLAESGKLEEIPNTFWSLFTTSYGRKCLRAFACEPFQKKGAGDDESVQDFFQRRFGRAFVETFVDPYMAGIWAQDPRQLSMKACFPEIFELEQQFGSLLVGALRKKAPCTSSAWAQSFERSLFSFHSGMELLPKTLVSKLDVEIRLQTPVVGLRETEKGIEVICEDSVIEADSVFSTLLPSRLAALLPKQDPLQEIFQTIPAVSLALVHLGYREQVLQKEGFGFLCSSKEEKQLLGIVFDSCVFPQQNRSCKTRLTVMMGGARSPDSVSLQDDKLQSLALAFCSKYLQIDEMPVVSCVQRAESAICCYQTGHVSLKEEMERYLKKRRLHVLGTGFYGISVNDCIWSARERAETFILDK